MSKGMRTYIFIEAYFFGQLFYNGENHGSGKLSSPAVKEKNIFMAFFNGQMHPLFLSVNIYIFFVDFTNGNKTLFVAFP